MSCPAAKDNGVFPRVLRSNFLLLKDAYPELVEQLVDKQLADKLSCGSNRKVAWMCERGHVWDAAVSNRVHGSGCPYCSGRSILRGFNDLATIYPSLASELVDVSVGFVVGVGSHRSVSWRCEKGHIWNAPVYSRVAGNGCPYCSGRLRLDGVNDLATTHPQLVSELVDDSLSHTLGAKSNVVVSWRCDKGHVWEASVANRTKGEGCPYCANKKVLAGFNDLATTHSQLVFELVDESLAHKITYGSEQKVEWRCDKGHVWMATPNSRTSDNTGCPVCAHSNISVLEKELREFLVDMVGCDCVVMNARDIIPPYELDMVVPHARLAIEFNGVYWHSEAVGRSKDYHLQKFLRCKAAGLQLLQVWEDDWRDKQDIVKRMIAAKLHQQVCIDSGADFK